MCVGSALVAAFLLPGRPGFAGAPFQAGEQGLAGDGVVERPRDRKLPVLVLW